MLETPRKVRTFAHDCGAEVGNLLANGGKFPIWWAMPRTTRTNREAAARKATSAPRRSRAVKAPPRPQTDVALLETPPDPGLVAALPQLPVGRSKYRPEIAAVVLERVACGETLGTVLAEEGMPDRSTWNVWLLTYEKLREAWIEARKAKAHALFDEALDIARDLKERSYPSEKVSALRVATDTLKWASAKLLPNEYGERPPSMGTVAVQINCGLDLGGRPARDDATDGKAYIINVTPGALDADAAPEGTTEGSGRSRRPGPQDHLKKPKFDAEWIEARDQDPDPDASD